MPRPLDGGALHAYCRRLGLTPDAEDLIATIRSSPPNRNPHGNHGNMPVWYPSQKMQCVMKAESHRVEFAFLCIPPITLCSRIMRQAGRSANQSRNSSGSLKSSPIATFWIRRDTGAALLGFAARTNVSRTRLRPDQLGSSRQLARSGRLLPGSRTSQRAGGCALDAHARRG